MSDEYRDIINLPHHVSSKRPQMSMLDRAAQETMALRFIVMTLSGMYRLVMSLQL